MKISKFISFMSLLAMGFAGLSLQAEEHEYIPLIEQGKTWKYVIDVMVRGENQEFVPTVLTSEMVIGNDTIVDGKRYWALNEYRTNGTEAAKAFLREDCEAKKVYVVYDKQLMADEELLYDFERYESDDEHSRTKMGMLDSPLWRYCEGETLADGRSADLFTMADPYGWEMPEISIMEGVGVFTVTSEFLYENFNGGWSSYNQFAANLIEVNPSFGITGFAPTGTRLYFLYSVELADGTQIFSIPGNSPEVNALKFTTVDNDSDAPAALYDLNGRPVERSSAAPGLYIERQGSSAKKLIVK